MPRHTRINPIQPEIEPNTALVGVGDIEATAESLTAPELEPTRSMALPKPPSGKLGEIHAKIAAPAGATIDDLVASTGWQPHTIRAAFSRLRRRGFPIVHATDADGRKAYRLEVREG